MAFVHDSSDECAKSELDIFQIPPTQTSIEKSLYVESQPIAELADNAPLEFFISGSGEYYYDLNNTLLYILCKIVKQDNTVIGDGARVGFINYPIASLFNQVDITLGDRLISQSDNLYTYRAYIETLLNYSPQTLSSQFTAGLFYKDTAGHHHDRTPNGENTGFNKRARFTAGSKTVEIIGPIYGDVFNSPRLILNGLDLKIKLSRNKDAFCLMTADAEHYKVQILQAALYVKRVQVSPAVRIGHSQALLTTNAKYAIDRVSLKVYSIPAGTRITNHENLFLGQIPKIVILGFVDNEAFSGSYQRNPLCFHHYNISHAALYVDGQQVPGGRGFQPTFQNDAAIREYMALVHLSGKQKSDNGISVDREEFMNGFTLFGFDLSPDQEPGAHFSLVKTGNLRAEIRFAEPTPNTINMIVYSVNANIIEINNRREILYDYN
ncbi:uncharacterized protein F54H12.2-like [Xenopus tropicalis]|uniref:Uncharacterized protein F54H12.2-like n=1 Tax=Xenopus tropicalis TaxID=8364 RepID=A0A8J1JWT7_XENTR|nr:uncharacterized protein F54H12.2-like [Xenopus tropicalis]